MSITISWPTTIYLTHANFLSLEADQFYSDASHRNIISSPGYTGLLIITQFVRSPSYYLRTFQSLSVLPYAVFGCLYLLSLATGMMRSKTANSAMEVSVERTEIFARLLAIFTFAGVRLVRPEVKTDLASVMNLGRTPCNTMVDTRLS